MTRTNLLRCVGVLLVVLPFVVPSEAGADAGDTRPDLIIGALSLGHDRAAPDTMVRVELVVENRGAGDAGPFRIAVYHSDGVVVPRRGNVTRIGALQVDKGLAAGHKASFSALVKLPPCDKCRPGSLYAFADAWGTVLERSEDNNFRAVPISIDAAYRPNLRVDKVTLDPDRGPGGREVRLSAVVRNTTAYAAQGPFKLGVYCSDDAEMTKADLVLTSWLHDSIPGNGQLAVNRKVPVDTRCPVRGQHVELGVVADIDNAVPESDESDNSDSFPYWVFRAPDLVAGQLAVSRAAAPPGARIVLSYRVQNEGKTAALPFKVGAYVSKDAVIGATDQLADTLELEGLAAQTTSGTFHQEITVPELASGNYFVGVIVDVDDKNGELRERNNIKAVPFAVRRVDITDRFFFLDKSSALAGDPLELRFSLRNTGGDTSAGFKVAFYFSADPRLDAKDERLAELEVKKLPKGPEAGEHVLKTKVPASALEGFRYVLMVMDDGDAIAELDEYDNVALRSLRIRRK